MDARDARVNMLPEIPIAGAYLRRGFLLWLVTRGTITFLFLLAGTDVRKLSTLALVEVVTLIVALGWLDTLRHHERALLGNLGVSPVVVSILFALPSILAESILWISASTLA